MNDCPTCRNELAELHRKIDSLDAAIRGNGKPGIYLRLDRLEQNEARRKRLAWFVIGAFVTAMVSLILEFFRLRRNV